MLGQTKIDEIEATTRQVVGDYLGDPSNIKIPIDLATILEKINLKLYQVKFDDPTVAGAYNKSENAIYVSEDDQKTRQLFTVAHELGHFFLNPKKNTDIFYRNQLNQFEDHFNENEQAANWFAASLLMPKELVEKVWKEEKDEDLLAARFGVSASAAHWRLKNLQII